MGITLKKFASGGIPACYHSGIHNLFFAVVLLLAAIAVYVPFSPDMPGESLDSSWMFGVNQALAQGLVFGKDIVFTFGPYASIYTKTYHPATDQLMIIGALYLGISFFLVTYLNFRKASWQSQAALLVALSGVMYSRDSRDPLLLFYELLVGVQVYRQFNFLETAKSGGIAVAVLLVALFAPLGLLPLIKGSALIACLAITIFSGLLLLKNGQRWLAILVCVAPIVSMSIFWVLADQPLSALPAYLLGLLPILSGYTEAMAISGRAGELLFYLIAGAIVVGFVLRDANGAIFDKSIVALMFLCILFLAFKAGFVRHDSHATIAGTMILMAAILAGTLTSSRSALIVFVISLAAWVCIDSAHRKTSTYSFLTNIKSTYALAWDGMKLRVSDSGKLQEDFNNRISELKARGGIPELNGTVDIYSYDQSYLIASGNKWNPRPIFQSYSAYTSSLAEKNKSHLLAENRPDNIIFKVQPNDGRPPSLDDGASWPVLISNYEPTAILNGYLYLRHRQADNGNTLRTVEISGRAYSLGEQVDLPESNGLIFAKINLKNSLMGVISNTLFKPSQLEIKLVMENGLARKYRIIAGMAESGFIISPLIESTSEFGLLFAGAEYVADKKVRTIEIQPMSFPGLWSEIIEIEFVSFEYEASASVIDRFGFSLPVEEEKFAAVTTAGRCDGFIDYINGFSPAPSLFKSGSLLYVQGWLAASVEPAILPDKVYLVLTDLGGRRVFIETQRTQRPDIGAHFNKKRLNSSGYTSTADVSKLKGDYVMGLAYSRGDALFLCPQFNIQGKIRQE